MTGICVYSLNEPQMVIPSANDFHLQVSSPGSDAGVTLPQVPCNFDGNVSPAPGGLSDIGAYKYGSSPGDAIGDVGPGI